MKGFKKIVALLLAVLVCMPIGQLQVLADDELVRYDHAWAFSASDKTSPAGAKIGEDDSFSYEYGVNGKFSPMTKYNKDWSMWTLDGQAPAVGEWTLSGSEAADGAIVWTAPRGMNVAISSTIEVKLDSQYADVCDGVGLMVLQQNSYGYAPIWPKAGTFTWYDVKKEGNADLSGITTKVREGDKLLFVVHSLGNTSVGDTIEITPNIQAISESAEYPIGFYDWIRDEEEKVEQAKPDTSTDTTLPVYNHGWAFENSDKKAALGATIDGDSVFSYQYGKNGKFQALNQYNKDWTAWTYGGNAPSVSGWYISASDDLDGAVVFNAPENMHVNISSTIKVGIDSYLKDSCDGVGFMVLQQNANGFAPLWPVKGSFEWYNAKEKGSTDLSGVKTYLKSGEKILFLTHSIGTDVGDTVNVSPEVKVLSGGTSYPDKFIEWVEDKTVTASETSDVSSWYIGEGGYKYNTEKNDYPFSYNYGFAGVYNQYLSVKESYDWGNVWRNPDQWAPWIAGYFVSAAKEIDGVITFKAPENGTYKLQNNMGDVLKLDTGGGNESDGAQFMVVAQNASGSYYPLYPSKGNWEWQTVEKDKEYAFKPITVSLKKDEKILFIAHSLGTDVNDTLHFDAKVSLVEKNSLKSYPSQFTAWPEGFSNPDPYQNPAKLSTLFTSSSASIGPLSLKYGYDGEYELMTLYREDWAAWTKGGNSPAIGAGFMGAVSKNDAVLVYTAPSAGQLSINSENDIYLDWGAESDGASVIVVLKNQNGERPIWPKDGEWEYEKITNGTEVPMKDISVFVQEGDEVHVIVRSTGKDVYDSVAINPVFDLDTSVTDGKVLEAVERVYPTEDDYADNLIDIDGTLDTPGGTEKEIPIEAIIVIAVGLIVAVGIAIFVIRGKKNQRSGEKNSVKEER